jgi:hypothetical protein
MNFYLQAQVRIQISIHMLFTDVRIITLPDPNPTVAIQENENDTWMQKGRIEAPARVAAILARARAATAKSCIRRALFF